MFQTYRPPLEALVKRGAPEGEVLDAATVAEWSGRSIRETSQLK